MRRPGHYLYVHVPFCDAKCGYCDFYSVTDRSLHRDLRPRWLELVARELELLVAAGEATATAPVQTVFFGGGTPSLLDPEAVQHFLGHLRDSFGFPKDAEITMEMQPGGVDEEKVRALAKAGINRFSIGVQSFNDAVLRTLGRSHTASQSRQLIDWCADHGTCSIDLISSVPGQTMDGWSRELDEALSYDVSHISVYELTFHPGTPFSSRLQSGEMDEMSEEIRTAVFQFTERRLSEAGFEQYEISNYARNGARSRHNENYWLLGDSTGLGAGAHSYIFPVRYANENDAMAYSEAIGTNRLFRKTLPPPEPELLTIENLYMGLRMCEGIDLEESARHLPVDIGKTRARQLNDLVGENLLVIDGSRLRLTPSGRLRFDSVLEYLL